MYMDFCILSSEKSWKKESSHTVGQIIMIEFCLVENKKTEKGTYTGTVDS